MAAWYHRGVAAWRKGRSAASLLRSGPAAFVLKSRPAASILKSRPAASLATWLKRWSPPPTLGERGERAAEKFLRRAGFKIVATRWRNRFGEHDLVAVEGRTIVFVEVKTRRSEAGGRPAEAVDLRRQQRLIRSAAAFLKARQLLAYPIRFDVVEVVWPPNQGPQIRHFRHAFQAEGPFHFHR